MERDPKALFGGRSKKGTKPEKKMFLPFSRPELPVVPGVDRHLSTDQQRRAPRPSYEGSDDIPHNGSLCRITSKSSTKPSLSYQYVITIRLEDGDSHQLWYDKHDFEFMSRLFAIIDTESRGTVDKRSMKEFVTLRCPVFWRRDDDLRKLEGDEHASSGPNDDDNNNNNNSRDVSPTFEEVWLAVTKCSKKSPRQSSDTTASALKLGVEGWMVFCRFVAFAQFLEAKRRFSARHLQQTMRHRNFLHGSEMVVVDVPPPVPPVRLTSTRLAEHERKAKGPLPLPELDLDHSLIAAHDIICRRPLSSATANHATPGIAKIAPFGRTPPKSSSKTPFSPSDVEFALTFTSGEMMGEEVVVRRSFADMKWLNETFRSHKGLGGTLCGRILPPFPSSAGIGTNHNSSSLANQFQADERHTSGDGTAVAVKAAAAASVGLIRDVAKSFWGNYVSPSIIKPSSSSTKAEKKESPSFGSRLKRSNNKVVSDSYCNSSSPTNKARQIERYLNYLLEHPALSTSFPLNTILKASQSGLEAAKLFLRDHAKAAKRINEQTPRITDVRSSFQFWSHGTAGVARHAPNLAWVRTAAQAAMALRVHGLLETTGLPAVSARLQHASLPSFDSSSRKWADEEAMASAINPSRAQSAEGAADDVESFEYGVVHVESELEADDGGAEQTSMDGYDLLPLPVPAPERRILCAGSNSTREGTGNVPVVDSRGARFYYGASSVNRVPADHNELESAFLGDFSVDDNIDKLREVIGSVDNTLSRCLCATSSIGESQRDRLSFHIDLVRGFDSWEGFRGRFMTQRALLKGVSGLEQSREIAEESGFEMTNDISWQTSLASSAVSAAEDVRSTVRAARTAASAKAAAESAAFAAQSVCEGASFASIDEARAAQTRASIARSHAIHAAVVEHEARTAKRRAALALAHDVKCWNIHRKRELLQSCIAYARSQHVATRRTVDAWSCLRDGYLGSSVVSCKEGKMANHSTEQMAWTHSSVSTRSDHEDEEVFAQVFSEVSPDMESAIGAPTIKAVDHYILAPPTPPPVTQKYEEVGSVSQLTSIDEEGKVPIIEAAALSNTGGETMEADHHMRKSTESEPTEHENMLTASMQSLVDGLMSWGDQYDSEEDLALPSGIAASIVMEESGVN